MIHLYTPSFNDLWFRQKLLGDDATMEYNHSYGGAIDFPKEKWLSWFERWITNHDNKRFYRYLQETETGRFVGETAYHYDDEREIYLADIIVSAEYRGKGYGGEGLSLLCEAAGKNGIKALCDDIAIDNRAVGLFLKQGFCEDYRTDEYVMLKKAL